MKTLKIYIKESIFDDVDTIANNDTILIEQFLKDNYEIDGTYIIDGNVVDVYGHVVVKNKNIESLTNGVFRFGKASGSFWADHCTKLKSLEGAPKEVGGDFRCYKCGNLKSIKGSPKEVGRDFMCFGCKNLASLIGAPKKVGGDFSCRGCERLTSLNSAPAEVGGIFNCSDCKNIKSLEGAPKKVGEKFKCRGCEKLKITDQDRKKYQIES